MKGLAELEAKLRRDIRRYKVPGAALGLYRNGRVQTHAAGVINLDTRVKTTTDSVFQIGSITKPLTTTLVLQLVDEGRLTLDAPVVDYLPTFRVADLAVSRAVTIRQLLSHTSGIDGDLFIDSGRGDEATARFVDQCAQVPSLFDPGAKMSYCNLGFAVLGRIIELLRNKSFDQALQDHLFKPLGMKHALSRPEDTLRFSSAIGHIPDSRRPGRWRVTPVPYLSFGQKAAGATPAMSVGNLLHFAGMHLRGGLAEDGTRILKTASVRAMQRQQIRLPRHARGGIRAWGLGWSLLNWQGHKLFGHDGATIGQFAFLRVLPEQNLAVALLTNGGDAAGLCRDLFADIFGRLARIGEPPMPPPLVRQPDVAPYLGRYENIMNVIDISRHGDRAIIQSTHRDSGTLTYPADACLTFLDKHTARPDTPDAVLNRQPLLFSDYDEQGRAQFLNAGFRQYRRTSR